MIITDCKIITSDTSDNELILWQRNTMFICRKKLKRNPVCHFKIPNQVILKPETVGTWGMTLVSKQVIKDTIKSRSSTECPDDLYDD